MKKRFLSITVLALFVVSAFSSIAFAQDASFYYDPTVEPEVLLESFYPGCIYIEPDVYSNNVLEVAEVEGFTIFSEAVRVAGAETLLTAEDGFTVLAPTDAAFNALPDGVLEGLLANPSELRQVILHHIIQDQYLESELPSGTVRTSLGKNVTISGSTQVDNATVVIPDITDATNGIVHGIDTVLLPPIADFTTRSRPAAPPQQLTEKCDCSLQIIIEGQRLNGGGSSDYKDRILALSSSTTASQYTVQAGDTLGQIAEDHYGSSYMWQAIYNANSDTLVSPGIIFVGQTLTIPLE